MKRIEDRQIQVTPKEYELIAVYANGIKHFNFDSEWISGKLYFNFHFDTAQSADLFFDVANLIFKGNHPSCTD